MIQLRKNCNHPDLLESAFDGSCMWHMVFWTDYLWWGVLTMALHFVISLAVCYPPVEQIVGQCGKFRLLDRLLSELFARKHKVCAVQCFILLFCVPPPCWNFFCYFYFLSLQVLIFSQWTKVLDIMDYYFSEKGFDVCRIDGSVKLDERKRQVIGTSIVMEIEYVVY